MSYAVDEDRIYATGQSGGAIISMAINIPYPDLFAQIGHRRRSVGHPEVDPVGD